MRTIWAFLVCASIAVAEESAIPLISAQDTAGPVDESLEREGHAAVSRGMDWLLANQAEDGHWSSPYFPALTGLSLWALTGADCTDTNALNKAKDFILSCVHEDGSIYRDPPEQRKGGGLPTYNTAICMVALHGLGDPELTPVILKARDYLAAHQHLGGDIYRGGMGYDESTGRPYADLSNSYMGYEAMRLTEDTEDFRKKGEKHADLDWKAAQEFLARVQDDSDDPKQEGGFIYRPDQSQAGSYTNAEGVVRFRTYGSMTYAGLLSLIYSDVNRDDPRVRSAFDWAARHWTLSENPGMGQAGLYYFYNVLSKSLAAYGRDDITQPDGDTINWRKALTEKLVGLQKIDPKTGQGYWLNEQGRWWEADPVLVTADALIALNIALSE